MQHQERGGLECLSLGTLNLYKVKADIWWGHQYDKLTVGKIDIIMRGLQPPPQPIQIILDMQLLNNVILSTYHSKCWGRMFHIFTWNSIKNGINCLKWINEQHIFLTKLNWQFKVLWVCIPCACHLFYSKRRPGRAVWFWPND